MMAIPVRQTASVAGGGIEFKSVDATVKEAKARALETRWDDDRNEVSIAPLLRETLEDHFADRTGAISNTALGYFLRQHAGRIERCPIRSTWRQCGLVGVVVVILDADRFKQVCVAAKLSERGESSQSSQSSQPCHPVPSLSTARQQADSGGGDAVGWDAQRVGMVAMVDVSPKPEKFRR
ncbi:MAG: hypothetical protein R3F44_17240 [Candidatus Competibacteraceae bacterium]